MVRYVVAVAPRSGNAAIVAEELAEAMQLRSKKQRREYTPEFVKTVTEAARQLGCATTARRASWLRCKDPHFRFNFLFVPFILVFFINCNFYLDGRSQKEAG